MAPIFEGLIAIGVGVLLCFGFLSEVSFIIRGDLPHVGDIILVILLGVFLWILLQDLDNLTTASDTQLAITRPNQTTYLACPTLSPERVS